MQLRNHGFARTEQELSAVLPDGLSVVQTNPNNNLFEMHRVLDANQSAVSGFEPKQRAAFKEDQIITRRVLKNQQVYRQNVSVRFFKPPTPEPEVVIVKEVRDEPQQLPPRIIEQRPPIPKTPPPVVLREHPPKPPIKKNPQIVIKRLPPDPPTTRQVIVEQYDNPPAKPRNVIIERWLPYELPKKKTVVYGGANEGRKVQPEEVHTVPIKQTAKIERNLIVDGIFRADPDNYLDKYGDEVRSLGTIDEQLSLMGLHNILQIADDRLNYNLKTFNSEITGQSLSNNIQLNKNHGSMNDFERGKLKSSFEVDANEDIGSLIKRMEHESGFNVSSRSEKNESFTSVSTDDVYV
ncbi:hypothetical protein ACOME3_000031 [Neoechinorhynchus agilis]